MCLGIVILGMTCAAILTAWAMYCYALGSDDNKKEQYDDIKSSNDEEIGLNIHDEETELRTYNEAH